MKVCILLLGDKFDYNFENWAENFYEINRVTAYILARLPNVVFHVFNYNIDEFPLPDKIAGQYNMVCAYFTERSSLSSYKLLYKIKNLGVDIIRIGIGIYNTAEHVQLLKSHVLDISILGEIEETLCDLILNKLLKKDGCRSIKQIQGIAYLKDGRVEYTEKRRLVDIHKLPIPNPTIYQHTAAVSASRSCYNQCKFCFRKCYYQYNNGASFGMRNPLHVVNEIEALVEKDIDTILFVDNSFFCSNKWNNTFMDSIEKRGIKLQYICSMRANDLLQNKKQLERFCSLGLRHIELGIESFIDTQLLRFNKNVTAAQNLKALEYLYSMDLTCYFKLLLFDPYTTVEDIQKTIAVIRKILWFKNKRNIYLPLSLFDKVYPYSNTPFYQDLVHEQLLISPHGYQFKHSDTAFLYSVIQKWNQPIREFFQSAICTNEDRLAYQNELFQLFWLDLTAIEYLCNQVKSGFRDKNRLIKEMNERFLQNISLFSGI